MMIPGIPTSLTLVVAIVLGSVCLAAGDEEDIRQTITSLSTHGSRLAGYPGDRHAADLVERRLAAAGITRLRREPYEVVVPIDYGAAMLILESEAAAEKLGEPIALQSLWPNLVRTNTLGPDGITGDLFYGGTGRYEEFNGHQVAGSIVLMEYNSWKNWKNAAALGAAAIIFIEPEETTRLESRHKWSWAPVHVPRFWLDAETALLLRDHLRTSGSVRVRLDARMDWESKTTWNIWGIVPGTDPELAEEVIAVQSYYDGISVVPANNPAAESAAGIAALLELAEFLTEHPPGRTVALLATGSHFLETNGLFEWFDRHARKLQPFRDRMPKRFVADALDAERLIRETARVDLTPDALGITLAGGRSRGYTLASVDLEKLTAELKLRRLQPDSLGIKLEPDSVAISLFVALDLSSHSDQIGVVQSAGMPAHRRFFVPLGRNFTRHGEAAAAQLGREPSALVNLVSPVKGLSWDSYLDYDSFRDDGGIAVDVGLMDLNIITTADARLVLDSPLDTPDRVDFTNVQRQSEMINRVLHKASWDVHLFGENAEAIRREHGKNIIDSRFAVDGRLRLLPRRSPTPDDPVPHGVVAIMNRRYFQPWRPRVQLADAEGNYRARGLGKGETAIRGFMIDGATGDITYSTDHGERAQKIGPWEQTLSLPETVWTTVLFSSASLEIHDRIHAHRHFTFGNFNEGMKVLDGRGAKPLHYGWAMGDFDEQMMVLFGEPGDSLRVLERSLMLLNNAGATDERSAQGLGFDLSGMRKVPLASLQSARDMWRLDDVRIEVMKEFAIENPRLQRQHDLAAAALSKAEGALQRLDWSGYAKYVREALGMEYRAYPDVRGTQNDVLAGLVFFVALMIPAAFFGERLLVAAPDIRRQLVVFGLIMLAIWVILSFVHPAFDLAHPAIVLLALTVMAMAIFVISLITSRFNGFMTTLRQRRAGTGSSDLSRTGTAYIAFMLGISNMRRRALRTGLTLTTITALTFSVLSFTSFKPQIQFVGFEKDWDPPYQGVLFHDINWWPWEPTHFDYFLSHFGDTGTVVPRTWMTMGFEGDGYIPVRVGSSEADARGLLGMTPVEPVVTGVDRALSAGHWFEEEEEYSVILSQPLAAQLGVTPVQVDQGTAPRVSIFGKSWQVIGLFDPDRFAAIRDLNNEPITPAKERFEQYNLPGMDILLRMNDSLFLDAEIDVGYEHLGAERLAILPYRHLQGMGADLRSVATRIDEGVDIEALVKSYLTRADFRFFVGMPDDQGQPRSWAYTSLGVTSMEGFGALIVPLLIACLIVLNTMMGAVHERVREIGVYSSVGLAPVHISFLFIAEAAVYGVLGVTMGYVIGQVSGKLMLSFDMLMGVSLNYSSQAAISAALLVMFAVVASTLYPARLASRLAVPDVVRRWRLPEPEDDVWQFPFPFTVNVNAVESLCGYLYTFFASYGHESVGKMYSEKTRIVVEDGPDRLFAVQLLLWLAPFDMGVSQYLQFTMKPTETPNIYSIELHIERISGPVAFWRRLNLGFMLDLRQQFLVWQTLVPDLQEEHAETCRQVAVAEESIADVDTAQETV